MTRVVGQLMLLNLLGLIFAPPGSRLFQEFQLVPALILQRPWTLITYQFLHGGFGHLFFNMIGLFFFGPRLEVRLGARHFIGLYLISGLVGAVVHFLFTLLPIGGGGLYVPMVGASAAVFGVLFGYAKYWPRDRILVFFVIPMEIRVFIIFLTAMSLVLGWQGTGNVAHFAHLGGFAGGWLYLRGRALRSPSRQFRKKAESPAVRMGNRQLQERWARIDPSTLHEVNREEYERIDAKIRSDGWGALDERERTFIDRFGARA